MTKITVTREPSSGGKITNLGEANINVDSGSVYVTYLQNGHVAIAPRCPLRVVPID